MVTLQEIKLERLRREQERRRQEAEAKALSADPTAVGIPKYFAGEGPEVVRQPSRMMDAANRTVDRSRSMFAEVAGAPVDVLTGAINTLTPFEIDPEQQFMGSASVDRFMSGTQAGGENVLRGVGMLDPQTPEERQAQREMADQSGMYGGGELFGEVASFAPTFAVGAGLSLIPRALIGAGFGAAEGGIIERGRGASTEEQIGMAQLGGNIGAAAELLPPAISRVLEPIVRRFGGVARNMPLVDRNLNATPELMKILDDAGLTIEDVQGSVMESIRKGAVPEQAERAARFRRQGIPATRGQITQDEVLLGREKMFLGRTDEEGRKIAAPLRQTRDAASGAFIRNAQEIIEDLGVPQELGKSVKDALTGRRKMLVKEKNELYRLAGEADSELINVPIMPDNIIDAIPDSSTLRRLSRIEGGQMTAFNDLLVEFGLDQNPAKVKKFLKGDDAVITPLSFSNFEDFRQGLNIISRADKTGAASVAINPVLDVLDKELDTAFEALTQSPNIVGNTLDIVKQARSKVKELKVEFDPKGTVDKLIAKKKGSSLPTVEQSEVYKNIMNSSIEGVTRVMRSLDKASGGMKPIKDLQASIVLDALEKATKAVSNKGGVGEQLFSATAFIKSLDQIGDDKLKIIFNNDRAMLKNLLDLKKTARDVVTPSSTMPKGSAPYVDAVFGMLSGVLSGVATLPVIKQVVDAVDTGFTKSQVRQSMDLTPQQRKTIQYISRDYPSLARIIGVGAIGDQDDQ